MFFLGKDVYSFFCYYKLLLLLFKEHPANLACFYPFSSVRF